MIRGLQTVSKQNICAYSLQAKQEINKPNRNFKQLF